MSKKIFIAHADSLKDECSTLRRFLSRFYTIDDFAVWDSKPLPQARWNDVQDRIKQAGIFVVVAGAFGVNADVIKDEIRIAKEAGLPVLVIERRAKERSSTLRYLADEVVEWKQDSINKALRNLSSKIPAAKT